MSYLGQVGLSDKVDGLYIGRVNLSIDVSNTCVKSMFGNSETLNIINSLFSYDIVYKLKRDF